MIEGLVIDTHRLSDGKYGAMDNNGFWDSFQSKHKSLLYKSQAVSDLQLYNSSRNLQGAKKFYLDNMQRHNRIINGNSFYRSFKKGIYPDIVNFDMKRFYPTIFEQICNHIDESYFGKGSSNIVRNRPILKEFQKRGTKFSASAIEKPIVEIEDIATNAVRLDCGDHSRMTEKIRKLSEADFTDEMDKRVAKITRNSLCFGFGFQNKNALTNNISALVMFFGREILRHILEEIKVTSGLESIYTHTDGIFVSNIHTGELDSAIRTACGLVDAEYFGNTEIISLSLHNINIKAKYEEIIVLGQYAYIGASILPQGKRLLNIKVAGLHTSSSCEIGETQRGESIQEVLNDNYSDLFSTKQIQGEDKDFLYSLLQHRLSDEYLPNLRKMWRDNDKKIYSKAVVISQTIKNINYLKGNLNATN